MDTQRVKHEAETPHLITIPPETKPDLVSILIKSASSAQRRLAELEEQIKDLQEEKTAVSLEKDSLVARLAQEEDGFLRGKDEARQEIDALRNTIHELENEKHSLFADLAHERGVVSKEADANREVTKRCNTLQKCCDEKDRQFAGLMKDYKSTSMKVDNSIAENAKLRNQVRQLEAEKFSLRTDLARIKAKDVISLREQIKKLEDENHSLSVELSHFRTEEVPRLQDVIQELKEEKYSLRDSLHRSKTEELPRMRIQVKKLEEAKRSLCAKLTRFKEEDVPQLRNEIQKLEANLERERQSSLVAAEQLRQEKESLSNMVRHLEEERSSRRASSVERCVSDSGETQETEEIDRLKSVIETLEEKVATLKADKIKYRERVKTYKERLKAVKAERAEAAVPGRSQDYLEEIESQTQEGLVAEMEESLSTVEQRRATVQENTNIARNRKSTFKLEIDRLFLLPRRSQTPYCPKLILPVAHLSRIFEQIMGRGRFEDVFFLPGQLIHLPGTGHLLGLFPYKRFDAARNQWCPGHDHTSLHGKVQDLFGSHCIKKSPGFTYFGRFRYHDFTQVKPDGHVLPKDMGSCMAPLLDVTLINIPDIWRLPHLQKKNDDVKARIWNAYLSGEARVVLVGLQNVGFNQKLADSLIARVTPPETLYNGKRPSPPSESDGSGRDELRGSKRRRVTLPMTRNEWEA